MYLSKVIYMYMYVCTYVCTSVYVCIYIYNFMYIHVHTTSISSILELSLLSYQCLWSTHCRSNSMGGWAPYFSLPGMFRSSTNTTHLDTAQEERWKEGEGEGEGERGGRREEKRMRVKKGGREKEERGREGRREEGSERGGE